MMRKINIAALLCKTQMLLTCLSVCAAATAFADFRRPPESADVPELLRTASGAPVTTCEQWEKVRRPELLKLLQENEYGVRPVERPADLAFEEVRPEEEVFGWCAAAALCGDVCR